MTILLRLLLLAALFLAAVPGNAQSTVATGVSEEATEANSQPKIARDASGAVHVAFVKPVGGVDQVFIASSPDNGRSWRLRQVTSRGVPARYPTLAVDVQGRLHLAWTQYEPIGHIYYARSDSGRWTAPVKISPGIDYGGIPAIALDPRGEVHLVWYGIRPEAPQVRTRHGSLYEIVYSGTSGGRWSAPIVISPGVPDSINPALAADDQGRLHSAWYQFDMRTYQVRYAQRTDRWQRPRQITARPMDAFAVSLALGRDTAAYLVWENRASPQPQIFFAESRPRWSAPQPISPSGQDALNPTVAVDDQDRVYVTWESSGQLYLRRRGQTWLGTERIAAEGANTHPILAAHGAAVDLLWTQRVGDDRRLRFATLGAGAAAPRTSGSALAIAVFIALALLLLWQYQRRKRLTGGS